MGWGHREERAADYVELLQDLRLLDRSLLLVSHNEGEFPENDRIHSLAHLYDLDELDDSVRSRIHWYPLRQLRHRHREE